MPRAEVNKLEEGKEGRKGGRERVQKEGIKEGRKASTREWSMVVRNPKK